MPRFLTRRRVLGAGAGAAAAAPAFLTGHTRVGAASNRAGPVDVANLPRRVFDSRSDPLLGGQRLKAGESVLINVGSAPGFDFSLGVFVNCTVTATIGFGWLTLFGFDGSGEQPIPSTSNINWATNDQTLANLVLCPVGGEQSIEVMCNGKPGVATHFILDIQGYVPVTAF